MPDISFITALTTQNLALFLLAACIIAFIKWGLPYFKESMDLFKAHRQALIEHEKHDLEKNAQLLQRLDMLIQSDEQQNKAINELSCEQFKKNVYNCNPEYPVTDRIANYVRYRRTGGNGVVKQYFDTTIKPGNEAAVKTIFDLMGFNDEDVANKFGRRAGDK